MEAVVVAFDWDLGGDLKFKAIAHGEGGRLGLAQQTIIKAGAIAQAVSVGGEGEPGD
jgi:hypothetical protein